MTKLIGIAVSSSNIEIIVPLTPRITLRCMVNCALITKHQFCVSTFDNDWNKPFTFMQKGWISKEIE